MTQKLKLLLPALILSVLISIPFVFQRLQESHSFAFEIALQSSVNAQAQLFYDIGKKFRQEDSVTVPVNQSNKPVIYRFNLPEADYSSLRFDPINIAGTMKFSGATIIDGNSRIIKEFPVSQFKPNQQIASLQISGNDGEMVTVANANDPMLFIPLVAPLSLKGDLTTTQQLMESSLIFFAILVLCWGFLWIIGIIYARYHAKTFSIIAGLVNNEEFGSNSARNYSFITFNRFAIRFYGLLVIIFLMMSVLGLHGSSLTYYNNYPFYSNYNEPTKPLLGTAKGIRVDEWNSHTPSILNQLWRTDTLSVEDSMLGPGKSILLGNAPAYHFTQLFRPQFWAFFVLPVESAFSVYWQFKTLLLIGGVFTLLLLLTNSSYISAFGALWYYFSTYTQWTFSWPSCLPEMIGLLCLSVSLFCYLLVARNQWLSLLVAILCASCAVNFALCVYVPHLVPLVWMGIFIVLWWMIYQWKNFIDSKYLLMRVMSISLCLGLIVVVMVAFFLDAKETIITAANTVYPGQRSMGGGGISVAKLLANFFDLWMTESYLPPALGNICEGSGYYWLAPVTLFLANPKPISTLHRQASLYLWLVLLLLLVWITLPIPVEIGKFLLLDRVAANRIWHVLGLLNVAIVGVFLNANYQRIVDWSFHSIGQHFTVFMGILLLTGLLLVQTNQAFSNFFAWQEVLLASIYTSLLVFMVAFRLKYLLAVSLLVPLIVTNFLVNPIDRGLDTISQSALAKVLQQEEYKPLREGKWLVFSNNGITTNSYVSAHGLDVFNGSIKYVPDLTAMSKLDPVGKYQDIYNMSGYIRVQSIPEGQKPQFKKIQNGIIEIGINPFDPKLKPIGIKYLAFDYNPGIMDGRGVLKQIGSGPMAGFWLYELLR